MSKLDLDLVNAFERFVPDVDRAVVIRDLDRALGRAARRRRVAVAASAVLIVTVSVGAFLGLRHVFRPAPPQQERPPISVTLHGAPKAGVLVGDAMWVATEREVAAIDLRSGKVRFTIPMFHAHDVAYAANSVWVSSTRVVRRIDPHDGRVLATIHFTTVMDLPPMRPDSITGDDEAIWVAGDRGMLAKVDPTDDSVAQYARLPGMIQDLDLADGQLWVAQDRWGLTRLDPSSGDVLQRIEPTLPGDRGLFAFSIAVTPEGVVASGELGREDASGNWGYLPGCALVRVDRVTARSTVSRAPGCDLVDGGDVGYLQFGGHRLVQVDLRTLEISRPVRFDGRFVFSASGDTIWITDGNDGSVRDMLFSGAPVVATPEQPPATPIKGAHPDGRIVFYQKGHLSQIQGDGTGLERLGHVPFGSTSVSPDGARIAVAQGIGTGAGILEIYSLGTGDLVQTVRMNEFINPYAPDWSPDGSTLVFMDSRADLRFVDVRTGQLDRIPMGSVRAGEPAWSPDGYEVAFVNDANARSLSGNLMVVPLGGGTPRMVADVDGYIQTPDWSPDARSLTFAAEVDGTTQLFVVDADGDHLRQITDGAVDIADPVWSSDGSWIAYVASGEIRAIRPDGSDEIEILAGVGDPTELAWRT